MTPLFKIVLFLFLSLLSEFYGVMRAVMITGEAGEAILVVQPFGILAVTALDIAHGTNVGADATLHTLVFLHMESLVGDEHVFEETAHYLGEERLHHLRYSRHSEVPEREQREGYCCRMA